MTETEKGIGKECKDYMVKELAKELLDDKNLFITSFWGLSAEDLNHLRGLLKNASSRYLVVKNSIAKMALKESKMDQLSKFIEGGVGIAFGGKDPINTVKTLVKFNKTHEQLNIHTAFLDGEFLSEEKIKQIASLPSKEALLTKLTWLINSPITGFVNVLAGTLRSLLYVVQAYKEKLEKGG